MSDLFELATKPYEEYMASVGEEVHKNYHACTNKLKEIKKLRIQCEKEKYEAMKKYNEQSKEIMKRMNEIITGESEPTEKEMENYIKSEEIPAKADSQFKKGIPAFWFCVLKNGMIFDSANGTETDINVLLHLKNIRVDYANLEEIVGKENEPTLKYTYKVHFDFDKNEYFTNETITVMVSCVLCDQDGEFEQPVIKTETPIEWNKDKDVRYKLVKRRGGKRGGRGRATNAVARQKVESFFDLFYTPELPADLNLEEMDEIDEDVITCHTHFKIFMELISDVYPMALSFFDESMVDDMDDMDDMDDEDDLDDEDDDDMPHACHGKCRHGHDDDEDDEDEEDDDGVQQTNLNAPPAPQECPQQ